MNAFENFLLAFAKDVVIAAPAIAPLFVHSARGTAIFNVSDEFMQAALAQIPAVTAPVTPPPAA